MENKSFTLIELLVVIAIIGLLSSIVLVSVSSVRAKARDTKRIREAQELEKALESYYLDNDAYPNNLSDLVSANLISAVPEDPSIETCYETYTTDYGYYKDADTKCYTLRYCLENDQITKDLGSFPCEDSPNRFCYIKTSSECLEKLNKFNNPGFEGDYTNIAPNWSYYGTDPVYWSRDGVTKHSGEASQKTTDKGDGGGVYQGINYSNVPYTGFVWLKIQTGSVRFGPLNRCSYGYCRTVTSGENGNEWNQYGIGVWGDWTSPDCCFHIYPGAGSTMWIDDAVLIPFR